MSRCSLCHSVQGVASMLLHPDTVDHATTLELMEIAREYRAKVKAHRPLQKSLMEALRAASEVGNRRSITPAKEAL